MKKLTDLRVTNIEDVLEAFGRNRDAYYKSPFAILAELEKKIEFKKKLEDTVLIPYKEDGYAIFDLTRVIMHRGGIHVAEYTYNSVVS